LSEDESDKYDADDGGEIRILEKEDRDRKKKKD
jgi:hypothetical protein